MTTTNLAAQAPVLQPLGIDVEVRDQRHQNRLQSLAEQMSQPLQNIAATLLQKIVNQPGAPQSFDSDASRTSPYLAASDGETAPEPLLLRNVPVTYAVSRALNRLAAESSLKKPIVAGIVLGDVLEVSVPCAEIIKLLQMGHQQRLEDLTTSVAITIAARVLAPDRHVTSPPPSVALTEAASCDGSLQPGASYHNVPAPVALTNTLPEPDGGQQFSDQQS